jgi:hypothetical protein
MQKYLCGRRNMAGRKRGKKSFDYHEHDTPFEEQLPGTSNVASANECTGLMPRAPQSREELENYQALSSMAIPHQKAKK